MPIAMQTFYSIMMMLIDMKKQVRIHKNEHFGLIYMDCHIGDSLTINISVDYEAEPHTVSHPVHVQIDSDIHGLMDFHYEFKGSRNNIEQDIKRYC